VLDDGGGDVAGAGDGAGDGEGDGFGGFVVGPDAGGCDSGAPRGDGGAAGTCAEISAAGDRVVLTACRTARDTTAGCFVVVR